MRLRQRGALGFARRRIEGVGAGLSGGGGEIVQLGGDKGKRFEFGLLAGPWCWTPLFVLFDFGPVAEPHKTLSKIATMPFSLAVNGENPCPKRRPNRTVFPSFTRSSSRASSALQPCPLADGLRKRPVDDIGRIELLLDQARAEIEIDGLLLVRDDAVIDRRDPDLRPASASSAARRWGCSSACPRSRHSRRHWSATMPAPPSGGGRSPPAPRACRGSQSGVAT